MPALIALARALTSRILGTTAGRVGLTAGAAAGGTLLPGVFDGDGGRARRRRRRRTLTSSDRSDIAFIVATLGPGAGKSFAMIVAARC